MSIYTQNNTVSNSIYNTTAGNNFVFVMRPYSCSKQILWPVPLVESDKKKNLVVEIWSSVPFSKELTNRQLRCFSRFYRTPTYIFGCVSLFPV